MSKKPVPQISRHLCRPTTKTSARRGFDRLVANVNNPAQSDVINPTSGSSAAHGAKIFSISTQTVLAGGSLILTFPGGAVYDTDSFFSSGANTKLTMPLKGLYLLECSVAFASLAAIGNISIGFLKNGSSLTGAIASVFPVITGMVGTSPVYQVVTTAELAVSDYMEVQVATSGASNQDIADATFSASYLGGL